MDVSNKLSFIYLLYFVILLQQVFSKAINFTSINKRNISLNGRCGKEYGVCREGYCCSKLGWCGDSDLHCKVEEGCQSEFGVCKGDIHSVDVKNIKISMDGRCGKEYGICKKGFCCSKLGWCGDSDLHCKVEEGCQSEFGECRGHTVKNENNNDKVNNTNNNNTSKKGTSKKDTTKKDTTKKDTSKKDTTKKDTTKKDTSKKDTTKKDTSKKDTSKKDTSKKYTSKKDTSKKDTSKKDTSKKDTSKKDTSKKDTKKNTSNNKSNSKKSKSKKNSKKNSGLNSLKNAIKKVGNKIKKGAEKVVTKVVHGGNNIAEKLGIDTAKFGAKILDMKKDKNGVYHADFNCWQKYFGYNSFYDFMFDLGTSMDYNNEGMFSYNGQNYILWAWKGDYINLGAGAELGIYKGGTSKKSHWEAAPEKAMPMTLTLTHKTKGTIVNKWNNNGQDSWWITSFNPKYKNVNAKDLTATYTVKFKDVDMYKAFAATKSKGWKYNNKKHTATLVL